MRKDKEYYFLDIIKLFRRSMRIVADFVARIFAILRIVGERLQIFLMTTRNQIYPEIRLLNAVSKKVSIIIPNFNGKKYLGECIDSLYHLEFTHEEFEIIVVDNASSDNSCEFISSTYPDVILIKAKVNLGFASGCNLGIKNSSGEYVILLNNDTVVDKNWLTELVSIADSEKDVAIVGSKLLFKDRPNIIQNAMSYLTDRGDGGDAGSGQLDEGQYNTTKEVMAVCGASMLIKRTLVEEIGALDEDFFAYYEDMDLCYRARLYGRKVIFAPSSVVYHVHSATSGEWSPFFTFLVFRNKLLLQIKNSHLGFVLKVLFLYCWQVVNEVLVKGVNRKIHFKVLASLAIKFPKILIKRLYLRLIIKRKNDKRVLLRLVQTKDRVSGVSVKKVCVYNAYLPTMGGGENLTAHTIAYVNRIFPSADIEILCHETEAYDKSKFIGKGLVQMLESEFDLSLKKTTIRYEDINTGQGGFLRRMRHIYKLSTITKDYDLFINNTYASLVPSLANVGIYFCMFPLDLDLAESNFMRFLRRYFYNGFLASYDIFLSISQYTQKWVDKYWEVNSYVLYPPVKTKENPINWQKDNIIISVGRFFASGHNKKQDVMVRAFIEMYNRGWAKDWKLVLVGRKHVDKASNGYIQALEELANDYPIELRFDIGASELQDLLKSAKIYWHATGFGEALDVNPEKFEHFGLSTIEAAQFGAVPVVFNGGGQPEIVTHSKNGFLWNTVDELTKYTRLLMDNDNVWSAYCKAAFESMKIFNEEKQLRWFVLFLESYYSFDD